MAPIYLGISGSWKEIVNLALGLSGSFRSASSASLGISGVWKEIFSSSKIPENLVALFASAPDSPWDPLSYSGVFPLGAEAEGESDLYSDTHEHATSVANVFGNCTSVSLSTQGETANTMGFHSTEHNYNHTHSATDHKPPYQEWRGAKANGAKSIPANAILFFSGTTLPDGWSRSSYTADKYVRLNSSGTGGTGGNATHTHTHPNATATAGKTVKRKKSSREYRAAVAIHTHTVPSHAATNNAPPYIILDAISPDEEWSADVPSGVVAFFVGDTVPDGWSVYSDAIGKFVKLNSTGVGTTSSAGSSHNHVFNDTSGPGPAQNKLGIASGMLNPTNLHTHPVSHTHDADSNNSMPKARELLICKKD